MSQRIANVWYATAEKRESIAKLTVVSDRGWLDIFPDQLLFGGNKGSISMAWIVAVSLTSQRIPWVTYLLVNAITIAYQAVRPYGWVLLAFMAGPLIAVNLIGLLLGANTRWVLVEYLDEWDKSRRLTLRMVPRSDGEDFLEERNGSMRRSSNASKTTRKTCVVAPRSSQTLQLAGLRALGS